VVEQPDGSWKETRWRFVEGSDPFVEKRKGVKIRYRYDRRVWVDTLLGVPGGFRLVRCRTPGG
jgi:hypothetical protein